MTARAEIMGRESKDALVIPVTALRSDATGSYVYVKGGNDVTKVYVKTGITTDKEVEIISGLNENDQIVVSGTVSQETSSTRVAKSQHGDRGSNYERERNSGGRDRYKIRTYM